MFSRHEHSWKETERIICPPINMAGGSISGYLPYTVERLVWGITTIVLTCEKCGDKRYVEMKGNG